MRKTYNLNDGWRFKLCGSKADEPRGWYRGEDDSDEKGWRAVTVPHDWAVEYPFSRENSSGTGYVCGGIGWYRLRFTLPQAVSGSEIIRLTFGGVYNNAEVWVNSNYLGKHPYGYSEFSYDITDFLMEGELSREIVVAVRVPHTETADSRWYTGSGITRPVTLTVADKCSVGEYGVVIETIAAGKNSASVSVKTAVPEGTVVRQSILSPDGQTAAVGEGAELELAVPSPSLWSPDEPTLYRLVTEVYRGGKRTDRVETKFGIRAFTFDCNDGFRLNGIPTKFKGVCLHHDAGALGAAVPKSVWRRRLMNLKSVGCNAIRTSHNPPDTALLDLCDELGFLVMDEAFDEWEMPKNKWWHGHNVNPPKNYGHAEDFPVWAECDLKTMIRRDRNHPSIVMWSIGNEIDYPNDPYVYPECEIATGNNDAGKSVDERRFDVNRPHGKRLPVIARRLAKWVKEVDRTRPVTMAMSFPELSTGVGLNRELDISGYNYRENLYAQHHAKFPTNIIIGSENGHGPEQWNAVADNDYISGQFLWTGIDYLGEAHGWPVRASGAGVFDLACFDKERTAHRRAMWQNEPYAELYIKPQGADRWRASPHYFAQDGSDIELLCFTNADGADFYINGRHIAAGRQENRSRVITLTVPYEAGTLEAVCSNGAKASMKTPSLPCSVDLAAFDCGVIDDDVRQIELTLRDKNGVRAAADSDVTVTVEGGRLLGLENGRIDDLTGYFENHRSTKDGRLLIYVKKSGCDTVVTVATAAAGAGELTKSINV